MKAISARCVSAHTNPKERTQGSISPQYDLEWVKVTSSLANRSRWRKVPFPMGMPQFCVTAAPSELKSSALFSHISQTSSPSSDFLKSPQQNLLKNVITQLFMVLQITTRRGFMSGTFLSHLERLQVHVAFILTSTALWESGRTLQLLKLFGLCFPC